MKKTSNKLFKLNSLLFVVGFIGVMIVTHGNLAALFWTAVAALHISASVKVDKQAKTVTRTKTTETTFSVKGGDDK